MSRDVEREEANEVSHGGVDGATVFAWMELQRVDGIEMEH